MMCVLQHTSWCKLATIVIAEDSFFILQFTEDTLQKKKSFFCTENPRNKTYHSDVSITFHALCKSNTALEGFSCSGTVFQSGCILSPVPPLVTLDITFITLHTGIATWTVLFLHWCVCEQNN